MQEKNLELSANNKNSVLKLISQKIIISELKIKIQSLKKLKIQKNVQKLI